MSIKSISTLAAATAVILGGLAIETSAGPSCGTGGPGAARTSNAARYSSAPRVAYVAPKPVAAKAAPAPHQRVAYEAPVRAMPGAPTASTSANSDQSSGGGDAAVEKVAKSATPPAPILRQAASAQPPAKAAPVDAAPLQQAAAALDSAEISVSAIAARLAALSGRRNASPIE